MNVTSEVVDTAQEEFKEETSPSLWDTLDGEFDKEYDTGEEVTAEGREEPVVVTDDEPEAAETAEIAPSEPAEEKPAVPGEAPPEEVPAPVTAEEVAPTPAFEEPRVEVEQPLSPEQRQALRSQVLGELTNTYRLSEEDAQAFETDPVKVLPKLAAELQLRVYESVVNSVFERLPQVIQQTVGQREVSAKREDAFFSAWPDLKAHKEQTLQVAQMWRQMNPKASTEEAIKGIGQFAMAALGLSPAQVQAMEMPSAPPSPAVMPSSPPMQHTSPTRRSTNPFEQLADEWDKEYEEPLD